MNGGPATLPTLPGSVVPRAKITVKALQPASLRMSLSVLELEDGTVDGLTGAIDGKVGKPGKETVALVSKASYF